VIEGAVLQHQYKEVLKSQICHDNSPWAPNARVLSKVVPGRIVNGFQALRADLETEGKDLGMSITIYGIKNCDTMKKARAWLDGHGVAYDFHDYKAAGIARDRLARWSEEVGWETLLNRAGTTFRKLPDADKDGLTGKKALALMLEQPSMIKRPVLELGGRIVVGFRPEVYAREVGGRKPRDRRGP
jgi:arsenate reductase